MNHRLADTYARHKLGREQDNLSAFKATFWWAALMGSLMLLMLYLATEDLQVDSYPPKFHVEQCWPDAADYPDIPKRYEVC